MKRNYEVSYTVTYRIIVAANSAAEAEQKASDAELWEWDDNDATGYEVEECDDT